VFGYRYLDDKVEEFNDLKKRAQKFVRINGHPLQKLIRDWPQLYKHLPYFKGKLQEAKESVEYLHKFFKTRVEEHRQEMKDMDLENNPATDFVMAFIQ
jgi:hypothetical protein